MDDNTNTVSDRAQLSKAIAALRAAHVPYFRKDSSDLGICVCFAANAITVQTLGRSKRTDPPIPHTVHEAALIIDAWRVLRGAGFHCLGLRSPHEMVMTLNGTHGVTCPYDQFPMFMGLLMELTRKVVHEQGIEIAKRQRVHRDRVMGQLHNIDEGTISLLERAGLTFTAPASQLLAQKLFDAHEHADPGSPAPRVEDCCIDNADIVALIDNINAEWAPKTGDLELIDAIKHTQARLMQILADTAERGHLIIEVADERPVDDALGNPPQSRDIPPSEMSDDELLFALASDEISAITPTIEDEERATALAAISWAAETRNRDHKHGGEIAYELIAPVLPKVKAILDPTGTLMARDQEFWRCACGSQWSIHPVHFERCPQCEKLRDRGEPVTVAEVIALGARDKASAGPLRVQLWCDDTLIREVWGDEVRPFGDSGFVVNRERESVMVLFDDEVASYSVTSRDT